MKAKRAYTIVVHDHSAAILRRFRITHRILVGAIAGAVSLSTIGIVSGLLLPFIGVGAWALYSKVDSLEVRNRELVQEKQRLDVWASEVGDRLSQFESDTLKLSALAELSGTPVGSSRRAGGPSGTIPGSAAVPHAPTSAAIQPGGMDDADGRQDGVRENDVTTSFQVNEVRIRTESLDRKMNEIEAVLLKRANRIDDYPLMRPASGADGDGFAWRNDPFTGLRSFHEGLDIEAAYGSPIVATADGVIEHGGYATGYGLSIFIAHDHQIETRYGHMSRIMVREGDHVARGQIIGYVGNSGRSSGPHLHYETLVDGQRVDPHRFLNAKPGTFLARSGS